MGSAKSGARVQRSAKAGLDRIMVSPEGVELHVSVAPFMSRVWALVLDLVIISLISTGIGILCFLFGFLILTGSNGGDMFSLEGPLSFIVIVWIISNFVLQNGYFIYFEMGDRAATWGKRALGIRVASRDGGRLTAEAIIARNILRTIELFIPLQLMQTGSDILSGSGISGLTAFIWVSIFASFPLFNKDRLRCGDLIAGTWVIRDVRWNLDGVVAPSVETHAHPVTGRGVARYEFSDADLSVYGEYELQTLESVLRTGADEALVAVARSICNKIGRDWDTESRGGDERLFLEAYYTALRAKLERNMRFGKRRKDKFSDGV
ncbi:RDD family protein [Parasphingorhabdus sp.]|uniref:RDD family protein n=1 Tax=Parasphingorhabdus sp. TaxID=2709688 RepID=UPI002F93498A